MKISKLVEGYFNALERSELIFETTLPVKAKKSEWEILGNPNRLVKKYKTESPEICNNFITELLGYEAAIGHNGKIIIEYPSIILEVYTHDINDVTELDHEYARQADLIFDDVKYFNMEKQS